MHDVWRLEKSCVPPVPLGRSSKTISASGQPKPKPPMGDQSSPSRSCHLLLIRQGDIRRQMRPLEFWKASWCRVTAFFPWIAKVKCV